MFGIGDNSGHPLKGASAAFIALNRNKRSIALDLKSPDGLAVARKLIASSQVLVHNFRPGVMERLGLGYEHLREEYPGLIYCEISGFGNVGPLAGRGANDLALQAHSGLISITGTVEGEMVRCGSAVIDLHCGAIATNAILAALLHRERTGRGQRVEASLLAASADFMSYFYGEYWLDGTIPKPMGTGNRLGVPNQAFPTTDGHVIIVANDDAMWRRIAQALDPEKLDIPKYRPIAGRRQHRAELIAAISDITRGMSTEQLVERLEAKKVVASPLLNVAQAAEHPQLKAIGGIEEIEIEGVPVKVVTAPFRMDETPPAIRHAPPALAAHTDEVLRDLGYAEADVAAMRERGAFGSPAQ